MSNFEAFRQSATIDQLEMRSLLADIKKSVELWFLVERSRSQILKENTYPTGSNFEASYEQIHVTCMEIMRHGLHMLSEKKKNSAIRKFEIVSPFSPSSDVNADVINKLIDDFEWVRRSAQIRVSLTDAFTSSLTPPPYPTITSGTNKSHCIEHIISGWVLSNLKTNCLCACLQALVADKELLHYYYAEDAFLRSDVYATSLFICLSSLELNQYSLLSQIDAGLYCAATVSAMSVHGGAISKHKRSSSHPNFSISPPKKTVLKGYRQVHETTELDGIDKTSHASTHKNCLPIAESGTIGQPQTVYPTFRKVKSLPAIQSLLKNIQRTPTAMPRPRSKTISASATAAVTQPKTIPKTQQHTIAIDSSSNTSSSFSGDDNNIIQPFSNSSTSSSKKSEISNFNMHSNTPVAITATMSTTSANPSAKPLTKTATACNIINCDDIKIWTDQSYEQQNQKQQCEKAPTESNAIPVQKNAKSISPINSFLCSLFSTPPSYTSWAINHSLHTQESGASDIDATAAAAIYPCNAPTDDSSINNSNVGGGGGVFDSFLPVYGQKLRSRKSQNLFEDKISSITTPTSKPIETNNGTAVDTGFGYAASCSSNTPNAATKNCQSLTAFLKMSQHSRNNTELERENAHFRISEAIISAIEHMKWAKLESNNFRRSGNGAILTQNTETTTAIDWLQNEQHRKQHNQQHSDGLRTETEINDSSNDEYIPYAEDSDIGLVPHSAEAVGLSLISKFNEKLLPKVSELKWLVSDDDTPQKLLPMPDQSRTANPDENVVTSMTRGTKYWAPPRQQIIFTDHPLRSRKEQIRIQNNRCAGCGMRVAPQYINSFRYCMYLGKYHCTGCHRNQISAIPAKILQAWDFKCYPVSAFAYRLLEQMYTYPLFYVPDLNPALYVRSKALLAARNKRVEFKFVKDFVKACRFATREQKYFDTIPDYITGDTDIWSLSDFIDVQNKSMQRSIEELIEKCENHIFNCVLCKARGFLCEYCKKDQVIYPWEPKIFRCDLCGSCLHLSCWKSMLETCCRCQRINKRQDKIAEI